MGLFSGGIFLPARRRLRWGLGGPKPRDRPAGTTEFLMFPLGWLVRFFAVEKSPILHRRRRYFFYNTAHLHCLRSHFFGLIISVMSQQFSLNTHRSSVRISTRWGVLLGLRF